MNPRTRSRAATTLLAGALSLLATTHGGAALAQSRGAGNGRFARLFAPRRANVLRRAPAAATEHAARAPLAARAAPTLRPVADPAPVRWQTGAHPTATVIYLHGLGGTPGDGLAHAVFSGLRAGGAHVDFVSPYLRDAAADDEGHVRSVGEHTMTGELARASALIAKTPGPIVLVGHSFGGKGALALAQMHPDRVQGVVALAPSVRMLHSYWKRATGQHALPSERAALLSGMADERAHLESALEHAETRGEARQLRSALAYHAVMTDLARNDEPRIDRVGRVPTVVIHGSDDQAVSIHYARRFAEENPSARFVELPGLDHGFNAEGHDAGAKALEREGMNRIVHETQRMIDTARRGR